jgi:hypothetical protein
MYPLPVPEAGVTVSQLALSVAVQLQDAPVCSDTLYVPALQSTVVESVLNENAHCAAPALCTIVRVVPATVIVPVLDDVEVLEETANVVVCVPAPADTAGEIHAADELRGHAHPAEVVTVIDPDPPLAGKLLFDELTLNEHATPDSVTVINVFATVNVPVREDVAVFGATLKVSVCDPVPI